MWPEAQNNLRKCSNVSQGEKLSVGPIIVNFQPVFGTFGPFTSANCVHMYLNFQ